MRLALFDLDGTVLRGNSWHEYFWWTARNRPALAPGLLARLAMRCVGLMRPDTLRAAALRPLGGLETAAVAEFGARVCAERLRALVRPVAREEIARARADGCEPVLATGAFDFLAKPLAAELSVREIVCTRLDYAGEICLGRVAGVEARGRAKADAVRERFAGREVDWARSRAYSDDVEDAPLFALVGEPVLVARGTIRPVSLPANVKVADWDKPQGARQ
jgi:HAD superfamily hydrolase (TIGR01490 family)